MTVAYVSANAQSLYEIRFADANNTQLKGLLVFFHENNSYIRIGYYSDNQYNVVEVNYKMEYGVAIGGRKYCMLKKTSNPEFITAKLPNQAYYADYFLWFYNDATGIYDDLYTTDDSTFQTQNYRKVISYIQLKPETLNERYLREFFWSDEYKFDAIKKMCGITPVILEALPQQATTKLHLILIANTNDPRIGMSCKADRINLVNQFQQMAKALNIGFKDYIVEGDDFSKPNVLSKINSVYPGSNDIVIFVYRGHGFRWKNQDEEWPRISLKNSMQQLATDNSNSLGLKEIKDMLDKKRARLNIVLGDCCNNEAGITTVTSNKYWQSQVSENADISKLRSLFISSKGSIISAAARPGEVSFAAMDGGLYSMSFIQALEQEISYFSRNACKWDNIFSNTIKFASDKSLQNCPPKGCTKQNGISQVSVSAAY
jgi:hypothetical protein